MKHTILLCTDTRKSQLIFLESTRESPIYISTCTQPHWNSAKLRKGGVFS